jgi:hypothetical protein
MVVGTLAIENIWIIDSSSGICIFDWYAQAQDKTIDEQLVSGLLIAFKNFSSEAGLVDISAIEGIDKKLAYKTDDHFIIAGVCHSRDYEKLIDETLLDLLTKFRKKYKDLLESGMTTDVSPFRTFEDDIIDSLEGTTSSRNFITMTTGIIISLLVAGTVFIGYFFAIDAFYNILDVDVANILGLLLLLIGMLLAGFAGGLVAGDRKLGIISGELSTLLIISLMVGFFHPSWLAIGGITNAIFFSLLYFFLFGVMAGTGGVLGGFIKESRFFFPLAESEFEDDDEEEEYD